MKLFLIFTILICCIFIGIVIKNYLLKREKFFTNLLIFLENILNNILFNNEKLVNILNNINDNLLNNDFKDFIDTYIKNLENKITNKEFESLFKNKFYYLDDFEKNRILQFFNALGSQTKEEEIKKINIFIKEILNLKNESKNKNKKYSNLYLKLFIALGLLFVIIFI
ncbi:MAG: hypothetical protein E7359_04410 [Clostridiales bacterium]|nr:hypothetical protein [Clostridiales bacterium]